MVYIGRTQVGSWRIFRSPQLCTIHIQAQFHYFDLLWICCTTKQQLKPPLLT